MPSFLKGTLFIITFTLIFNACSSTQEVTGTSSTDAVTPSKSIYPDWYSQNYFASDSLAYHGYGDAVSGDSVVAMANAELQARANLEKGISDILEEIRVELQENGSGAVSEPSFLIALRRAHQQVETEAEDAVREAKSDDSIFRGYAQVSISKSELLALLEDNLSVGQWNLINSARQFSEELN